MTTLEGRLDSIEAKLDALVERLRERAAQADQPDLLTPKAAAAALSVSTKTIGRMVRRGQLRTVQVGRHWRVPRSEVERFSTPKTKAPQPKRRGAEQYDVRAEYAKSMKRLGGRR